MRWVVDGGLTSSKMVSGEGTEFSNLSTKTSSTSVPPTPRSQDEILQSSNMKSFALNDLKAATRNFRPDSVIGEGGFGSVFKGWIDEHTFAAARAGSGIVIAVKRLNQEGWQGHTEWLVRTNLFCCICSFEIIVFEINWGKSANICQVVLTMWFLNFHFRPCL